MPPNMRCRYTEGERAVLCIIAGEVKHHGVCDLPIDKIATLAGVCRTTVQTALHEARRQWHLRIIERPRPGRKNLTNVVEITWKEWLRWIKRGPPAHQPIGSNLLSRSNLVSTTKNNKDLAKEKNDEDLEKEEKRNSTERPQGAWRGIPTATGERTTGENDSDWAAP